MKKLLLILTLLLSTTLYAFTVVPMRIETDCEESSLATAAQVSYEQAKKAIGKTPILPEVVTNPMYGNPVVMKNAIEKLGFKAITRTQTDILSGVATPNKTIVLLVASPTQQHWVVFAQLTPTHVGFHWGDNSIKMFTHAQFKKYFGPTNLIKFQFNAAYEVGPKQRRTNMIQKLLNFFKNLFR
jgi:hypothetical protein